MQLPNSIVLRSLLLLDRYPVRSLFRSFFRHAVCAVSGVAVLKGLVLVAFIGRIREQGESLETAV